MAGKPKSLIEAGDDDYKVGYCKPPRHTRFNARSEPDLDRLMGDQRAAAAFLDPPYNVSIKGVVGRGRRKHGEFAMASGEMSRGEFVSFLTETLCNATTYSREGAVHYVCMDWRHLGELIEAGREIYSEMLNLAVWVKSNAGQGSFYRSQHELIGVFRVGGTPHLNNVMAAERVGRRVYALELEPRYVDVAIRRWQSFTRQDAVHAETGSTFDELALDRSPPLAEEARHKRVAARQTSNGLDRQDRPE